METWQIVIGLITALGLGSVATLLLTRIFAVSDKKHSIHETNRTAEITASAALETQFRQDLLARVSSLEQEAKEIKAIDRQLAIDNTCLTKDNDHLREQNQAQASEIEKLRNENTDLRGQFQVIKDQFEALKQELRATTIELNLLKSQWNRFGKDPSVEIEKEVLRRLGSIELNRPQKVLVIDDDESLLGLFGQLLSLANLQCVGFGSGWEAIEWLRHNTAAVIVTDLAIDKDLDGLSLIERIRGHERRNKKVPAHIIIYTGFDANEGITDDSQEFNVEAIVKKTDATPQDVVEMIKTLAGSKPAAE